MMKVFDCHLAVLFCCKKMLAKFGFDGEQWLGVEFRPLGRVRESLWGTVSVWSFRFVPKLFRGMVEFRPFERVQESLWRTVSLNVED